MKLKLVASVVIIEACISQLLDNLVRFPTEYGIVLFVPGFRPALSPTQAPDQWALEVLHWF
jgi:hypothetical protein